MDNNDLAGQSSVIPWPAGRGPSQTNIMLSLYCRVTVILLALMACSSDRPSDNRLRVALITPGSIADAAWNAGAYQGLQWIGDSLGLRTSHVEARTPGAQEEALRIYANQGYHLVFGHGFEFQDPAERVAQDYPETVFVITSGVRVAGNVAPMIFRLHEGTYLAGMVAGGLTRTGVIGFVGGIELPPIVLGYQGWANGAAAVRSDVDSRISYLNNFDDATAGHEAALALIRLGADMLHHNADAAGLGVFQAAKENSEVFIFGANADQSALAPTRVIGSAVIDLPRAFLMVARDVAAGTFVPEVKSFGLASGVISYRPNPAAYRALPPGLGQWIDAVRDSITTGALSPLTAPRGDSQ